MPWKPLMDNLTADFISLLGNKLVGIYIHGSIAFGCFRWECSDVDFLAVVKGPLALDEKAALIRAILKRASEAPEKGIEMSVVTEAVCRNFVYPTPYELHFSNAHLNAYRADTEGYCQRLCGSDPDLAGHFAVTKAKGIAWHGRPIDEVFGEVPRSALLASIRNDIMDAQEEGIAENPVYYVLNLCRVIACQEQGLLLSKREGGQWGIQNLPQEHWPVIQSALDAYTMGTKMDAGGAVFFRDYALERILGMENHGLTGISPAQNYDSKSAFLF